MIVQERSRVIPVAADIVWDRVADVARWPAWYPAISEVAVAGPLGPDQQFSYSKERTRIEARVVRLCRPGEFEFIGRAWGVEGRNRWAITALANGETKVTVEERMTGLLARILRRQFTAGLGRGLDDWLDALASSFSRHEDRNATGESR
ncbi:MAG: SRPBCC family protein [Gemmatimonadaceae bacterium]|nr:SRPBCC family protein [Gemmatimonadaceae bacterium]